MCEARAWPASTPPVRQLMTPGGIPACVDNEAMKSVENGFCSLVFITIVLPQARAGATFIANVISGALKGQIPAQIPQGWWSVYCM